MSIGNLPSDSEKADSFCALSGGHVIIHRPAEMSPLYMTPATALLLGIDRSRMDDRDLVEMVARNMLSCLPGWQEYQAHFSTHGSGLLWMCLKVVTPDGRDNWLCGCSGRLDGQGTETAVLTLLHHLPDLTTVTSIREENARLTARLNRLTPREREVLVLMGRQLSTLEIASRLHLSRHTVTTHRKSIIDKLGAKEVLGLAPYLPLLGHSSA